MYRSVAPVSCLKVLCGADTSNTRLKGSKMAGIFFSGGVACNLTVNAACGISTTGDDCPALYYPPKCNTQVDPLQMNAVISEIANAINAFGNAYDCSRLDNLKNVLNRARNICDLPPFGDNPDLDDRIAGCFDETSSTISVQQLVNLVLSQAGTLCDLPEVGGMSDGDTLAGCIGGAERRINLANLRNLMGGGGASALVRGAQIYFSGAHTTVGIPTADKDAFMAMAYYEIAGGDLVGDATLSVATGGGGFVEATQLYNGDAYIIGGSGNSPALTVPIRTFVNVIKKNNIWYLVVNGTAMPLGGDDGVIRFANGTWSKLTIWDASRF
ncbi:putative structural protein [Agrobacterium phage OLIVR4]|nr:putative structural protein [Agrobacterium phage OLIVR4]